MAYRCQYAIDRGVLCPDWTREDEDYCAIHDRAIKNVEAMWQKVTNIVTDAQKKTGEAC